jgi:hypothetical protein
MAISHVVHSMPPHHVASARYGQRRLKMIHNNKIFINSLCIQPQPGLIIMTRQRRRCSKEHASVNLCHIQDAGNKLHMQWALVNQLDSGPACFVPVWICAGQPFLSLEHDVGHGEGAGA